MASPDDTQAQRPGLGLPGAIIIAAAIIACAIIWIHKPTSSAQNNSNTSSIPSGDGATMAPVTASDHILGNPNAKIKFIEYGDPSCPYCKLYNPTMERIMSEYGPGGNVAWVYRQFPLDIPDQNGNVLHPNAAREAEAFECAASLGGNTAFWAYEKEWFEKIPEDGADRSTDNDNAEIASVAKDVGLDPVSFNDCVSGSRYKDKIDQEFTDGVNAGVTGTPYTILLTPSGSKIPLAGQQQYSTLKTTIDTLISSGSSATTTS